jgi:hypothetical protein
MAGSRVVKVRRERGTAGFREGRAQDGTVRNSTMPEISYQSPVVGSRNAVAAV